MLKTIAEIRDSRHGPVFVWQLPSYRDVSCEYRTYRLLLY